MKKEVVMFIVTDISSWSAGFRVAQRLVPVHVVFFAYSEVFTIFSNKVWKVIIEAD